MEEGFHRLVCREGYDYETPDGRLFYVRNGARTTSRDRATMGKWAKYWVPFTPKEKTDGNTGN